MMVMMMKFEMNQPTLVFALIKKFETDRHVVEYIYRKSCREKFKIGLYSFLMETSGYTIELHFYRN